jgi:hypothetical protein
VFFYGFLSYRRRKHFLQAHHFLCSLWMSDRLRSHQATQIRTTIKAVVAQLDRWEEDQAYLTERRISSNQVEGGRELRHLLAQARARQALGTVGLSEPPCEYCNSSDHLPEDCPLVPRAAAVVFEEEPATGIHRGIVHRLFAKASELYSLLYPRFYQGLGFTVVASEVQEVLPVPLTGPDYQVIAIRRAARAIEVVGLPSTPREHLLATRLIGHRFYSDAFPLDFDVFLDRVYEYHAEAHEGSTSSIEEDDDTDWFTPLAL